MVVHSLYRTGNSMVDKEHRCNGVRCKLRQNARVHCVMALIVRHVYTIALWTTNIVLQFVEMAVTFNFCNF